MPTRAICVQSMVPTVSVQPKDALPGLLPEVFVLNTEGKGYVQLKVAPQTRKLGGCAESTEPGASAPPQAAPPTRRQEVCAESMAQKELVPTMAAPLPHSRADFVVHTGILVCAGHEGAPVPHLLAIFV